MAKQYWIGDFFIDLSRNQITQNKQPQVVAPKALAVLTLLAKNQGEVVSQETLLSTVWPDTIVSPNSLQRSIAQLRKALGDDGKGQVYIKTHSKQGYSLECEVNWQVKVNANDTDSCASATVNYTPQPEAQKAPTITEKLTQWRSKLLLLFSVIFVSGFIGAHFSASSDTPMFSVGELRALTSSDGREFASIYSPDGKYIIFHRYSEEACVNNIWAKDLVTKQEYKLTDNIDSYGRHSFSKDGKQLVFIRTVDCDEPITQKKCFQLMSIDFAKALKAPQPMQLLLECKNSEITRPHWLNNNNIALLQKDESQWQLISYSTSENKSQVIHKVNDGNIVYYDYSTKDDLLAVISIHKDNQHYIELLTPNGELISSNKIVFPPDTGRQRLFVANFSPIENHLVFSTGRQMFTLSFNGIINNVSIPLDQPAFSPSFHPDGDRALIIKGQYDSDILSIPLADVTQNNIDDDQSSMTINRSTVADDSAVLQPNGETIAFVSARSGEDQVWLSNKQGVKQLSQFPIDSYISGIKWSADGGSLLVNVNNKLVQLQLDARQTSYSDEHIILELLHWDSVKNTALTLASFRGVSKLTEFNLLTDEVRILTDRRVNWASKTESGDLIYTDHMDRFWRSGAVEAQHIPALDGHGGDRKHFLVNGSTIYGVSNELELWSYNLSNEQFNVVGKLPSNIANISEINARGLFATARISSKKEVVELLLNL
ncbi:winged helix-turn-helix domain-containing protein [Pseudoalteromonas obscura]|uniref:Winged helix-turn-helix domain-containing protein n=1 Tax=Pseudoalteromonas obscura TaxID=3048491 RepID=A0ABT7EJ26_9GAMM|nr:winged helix-turn-helix domain-containing protein [Pseudoalteromonas sp. P94(2023)]MDK2595047.1 winged helix-turn-helix domain-containing protein [Pseudoalteromonas sp. P94(2023)]